MVRNVEFLSTAFAYPPDDAAPPCPIWAYYSKDRRFSGDQVGIELDPSLKCKTWASPEEANGGVIRVCMPHSGADKRFATLQVCLSGDPHGPQPRGAVILRGKGRVTDLERSQYPEGIDIYHQDSAWADSSFLANWTDRTWKDFMESKFGKEWVLFVVDN